jgi:hypothetical protein
MSPTIQEIAESIAEAGALIGDERDGVINAARLTAREARAALEAIGQMTIGNARDFRSWRGQISGTRTEWKALLRAEAAIASLYGIGKRT